MEKGNANTIVTECMEESCNVAGVKGMYGQDILGAFLSWPSRAEGSTGRAKHHW